MEEPTKLEHPSKSGEASDLDSPISPQSSTSNVPSESYKSEDVSPNCEKSLELDDTSSSSPKQCESPGDGQDFVTNEACESSSQSINVPTSSHSSGELDIPKFPEPSASVVETSVESSTLPQACNVKSSYPTKCEVGVDSPNSPNTSELGANLSEPSPLPSESGGESPKSSNLPSESGIESPKSPYPSESSIESPESMASNESGELIGSDAKSVESGESPKSASSSDSRRKSKLMATYSIKNETKVKLLANQLELVANEREKDVMLKQEYKEKEESLKDKRESIYKQMHVEERKAKMDRKASTRKGSNFRIDLNASKRDMRKDDLNRKKEEDERNKQLLLQRARDEKTLRKSIYATNKTSSASSSPNSSSPPPDEKD